MDKPLLTDYNGDGFLDMLLGNKAGNIMLYTQTGRDAVTFTAIGNLTADGTAATVINMGNTGTNASNLNGYAAPAITDIDGDGLLDLFVGNGSGSLYRYEQAQSSTVPTLTAPLPVVLTAFVGQATSAGNRLNWTTALPSNSKLPLWVQISQRLPATRTTACAAKLLTPSAPKLKPASWPAG